MPNNQAGYGQSDELAVAAAVVLDPRLTEIWQLIWGELGESCGEGHAVPLDAMGALLRLAYVQGYADAAVESDPAALWVELGVRDPALSRSKRSARLRGTGRARRGSSGR
jgi:hypothetical protein